VSKDTSVIWCSRNFLPNFLASMSLLSARRKDQRSDATGAPFTSLPQEVELTL
jgi:hypothetical protein